MLRFEIRLWGNEGFIFVLFRVVFKIERLMETKIL